MNTKLLVASLLLASSSVAMAAPTVVAGPHPTHATTTTVRDRHPADDCSAPIVTTLPIEWHAPKPVKPVILPIDWHAPRPAPMFRGVTLGAGLSFAGQGRKFITVGAQAGRFDALKISADMSRTFIKQVYVQFDNGQEQVVRNLDRTLTSGQSITLDLDGNHRAIRRIVVYGNEIHTGARIAAGTFTVTAG